jgi:hypothetical protein
MTEDEFVENFFDCVTENVVDDSYYKTINYTLSFRQSISLSDVYIHSEQQYKEFLLYEKREFLIGLYRKIAEYEKIYKIKDAVFGISCINKKLRHPKIDKLIKEIEQILYEGY